MAYNPHCLSDSIEFIFSMLVRNIKDIFLAKVEPGGMNYPEWRVIKIQNQAGKFRKSLLKNIVSEMAKVKD
jgi:hypothetical protein